MTPSRVVIAGGGTAGFQVARRLERAGADFDLTLISPDSAVVYQSLLPELAAGSIEPRHAVVPLRAGLSRTRVLSGELLAVDSTRSLARVCLRDGTAEELAYDHLVVALGAIANVLPIPGLDEHAIGFQTVAEALHLRDRIIDRLQLAATSRDPEVQQRALTFVFVGGGYSGIEALGELESMGRDACREFPELRDMELRWVLIEATDRILPMVRPSLGRRVLERLRERGIDVRLQTLVESVEDRVVNLSDGTSLPADTLVWCAGIRPNPRVAELGLAVDDKGALLVEPTLQVQDTHNVWGIGDCAKVPDLVRGGSCPPSAQYALRQAKTLAGNLVRTATGKDAKRFRYRPKGELITFGRSQAVGEVFGIPVSGLPAWLLRHTYHVLNIPTPRRKLRLWIDWTVNLAFPREISELGSVRYPRAPIAEAVEARDRDLSERGSDDETERRSA